MNKTPLKQVDVTVGGQPKSIANNSIQNWEGSAITANLTIAEFYELKATNLRNSNKLADSKLPEQPNADWKIMTADQEEMKIRVITYEL